MEAESALSKVDLHLLEEIVVEMSEADEPCVKPGAYAYFAQ